MTNVVTHLASASPQISGAPGTTLLCLDLQPVFVQAIAAGAAVLRRCQFAVAAAAGLGIPIVFTEQVPAKLGAITPEIFSLAPGAPAFGKTSFSALGDAEIRASLLEKNSTEHLLLCGLETSVCVYQTALDAVSSGLQVTILADAVGARHEADHATCLDALRALGVHVLPSETVFYAIVRDASHPYFREYTRLVKSYG